jgi:hypothetical protein
MYIYLPPWRSWRDQCWIPRWWKRTPTVVPWKGLYLLQFDTCNDDHDDDYLNKLQREVSQNLFSVRFHKNKPKRRKYTKYQYLYLVSAKSNPARKAHMHVYICIYTYIYTYEYKYVYVYDYIWIYTYEYEYLCI